MDSNSVNNFNEDQPSLVQIGTAVWEKLMFKEIVDTARWTTDTW